jgi:5-methyltetrahydrofolate--homocysteine methyltransferase
MGNSIAQITKELIAGGADIIGTNCGNGIENMIEILKEYKINAPNMLFLVQPNAGLPVVVGDKTIYKETPEIMKAKVGNLIRIGLSVLGGCCGTTPDHISAFRDELNKK